MLLPVVIVLGGRACSCLPSPMQKCLNIVDTDPRASFRSLAYPPMSVPSWFSTAVCTPVQPHTLLGSALGLLLVFRTNAAYQRFQEGRKLWEQVLNVSRDIARMTSLYEDGE